MSEILGKEHSRDKKYSRVIKASLFPTVSLVLFFLIHCRSQVLLQPLPSTIERIEGYASIKFTGDHGSARSKFSFLFVLPHHGRIEVSNIIGKTLYLIVIDEERAIFVLPSKKVYWQGDEEEIINKFLGFRLNLCEMISLLSGKWKTKEMEFEEEKGLERWSLEKDEKGRIIAGQRGELIFEVKEFLANTPFARLLAFQHSMNRGRLKILSINFNQPIKKGVFSLPFLENYRRVSWAEIEKILANEN